MSFYDPDSLLFLNGIGSNPTSPKNNNNDNDDDEERGRELEEEEEEEELLSKTTSSGARQPRKPQSGKQRRQRPSGDGSSNSGSGDEEDRGFDDDDDPDDGDRGAKDNNTVARKVRESIQLAKRESDGQGSIQSGLDVELVEMLLGELEGTKREMSDLQGKYNAFRVTLSLSSFSIVIVIVRANSCR